MNSFDHSLKYLVGQQPADFIAFGLGQRTIEILDTLVPALPARDREIDGAYLVALDGRPLVVHLEYQRRHESQEELALDVADAQLRLYRREARPVVSQVWDLYGSRSGALLEDRLLSFGGAPGAPPCQSSYRRVNLRALRADELLAQGPPALWPLIPLTGDGQSVGAVQSACDAIESRTDLTAPVRADHLAVLLFMGVAEGLPSDLLRAYISREKVMKSAIFEELFPDIIAEKVAEKVAESEVKTKADLLLRILMRRFQFVDDLLSKRVRAETRAEVLDAWLDEAVLAMDDKDLQQLVAHIKRTSPPGSP